jgi:hypothetical protein
MIVIYSFWHRISGEGGRLKRFVSVVISMIMLVLISVTVSSAASADFTLRSAQGKPNHIVTLDMVCSQSELAAAIFEFDFDSDALEFKEVEKDKGVKIRYNKTGDKLRVVYYNYDEISFSDNVIFSLKFKAHKNGEYKIPFSVSECVDSVPNDISAGKCEGAVISISDNASVSADSDSESSASSNQKDKKSKSSANSKDNTNSKTNDSDDPSDDDEKELDDLGTINDIEEKSSNPVILIYILVGVALVILIITGIKIGMYISAKKNNNNKKTDDNTKIS